MTTFYILNPEYILYIYYIFFFFFDNIHQHMP